MATRAEHMPMLLWIAEKVRDRVRRGRLALVENPEKSRALQLECFTELEGLEDGLIEDAYFRFVVGDQCMLGQHDRESGLPFRGRTKLASCVMSPTSISIL